MPFCGTLVLGHHFLFVMRSHGHKWTAEEDIRLRELAGLGVRLRNVALKLGRTENGVRKRARQLGVNLQPNLPQQFTEADLIAAHRRGS